MLMHTRHCSLQVELEAQKVGVRKVVSKADSTPRFHGPPTPSPGSVGSAHHSIPSPHGRRCHTGCDRPIRQRSTADDTDAPAAGWDRRPSKKLPFHLIQRADSARPANGAISPPGWMKCGVDSPEE